MYGYAQPKLPLMRWSNLAKLFDQSKMFIRVRSYGTTCELQLYRSGTRPWQRWPNTRTKQREQEEKEESREGQMFKCSRQVGQCCCGSSLPFKQYTPRLSCFDYVDTTPRSVFRRRWRWKWSRRHFNSLARETKTSIVDCCVFHKSRRRRYHSFFS